MNIDFLEQFWLPDTGTGTVIKISQHRFFLTVVYWHQSCGVLIKCNRFLVYLVYRYLVLYRYCTGMVPDYLILEWYRY